MELVIELGLVGWIVVVAAALVFGVLAQLLGETRTGYEWLVDSVAFGIGAIVASEFVIAWQAFEPVVDGLALGPALLGGLVVGTIVEVGTRVATGGHYTSHQHMPA
jgi:uncharacterized membrane protein YeaQ/YmgE (transglycosylase-associated protein family)